MCQLRIGRMVRLPADEDSVLLENYELHDIMHWYLYRTFYRLRAMF